MIEKVELATSVKELKKNKNYKNEIHQLGPCWE